MEELIIKLRTDYPNLTFVEGSLLCWSPTKREIYYDGAVGSKGIYGVLHEIGHARLHHTNYESDIDLLKKEVEAWEEAERIAKNYGVRLDFDHIQDCLDTYREWIHKRSTCPQCNANGLQASKQRYSCLNCGQLWCVTAARFFRPYRLSKEIE